MIYINFQEHTSSLRSSIQAATVPPRSTHSRRIFVIHCVLHEEKDSVAVVVVEGIEAGQNMNALILDDNRTITIKANAAIPIGHKVAVKAMAIGDTVMKYGTDIGKVVAAIAIGDHAHVHNIKTKRW
jgi:(2R)-sulfolactate sulfo-lyase subunit alpha